jgi:hypothetical protein
MDHGDTDAWDVQGRHALGQFGALHRLALRDDGRQESVLNSQDALFESRLARCDLSDKRAKREGVSERAGTYAEARE